MDIVISSFLIERTIQKVASDYNGMMKGLVKKYNKYNEDKLPHITPHSLRHTFCTNYANAGMNPKALQYIMGHANIAMTLNYYAHATFDSAMAEMKRLNKEEATGASCCLVVQMNLLLIYHF